MGRWLKSSSGFATVGVAMAMVAASVLALAGVGSSKSAFDFGSGFSWLSSDRNGEAALVNGADGKASARRKVPGANGKGMKIVQRDGHAYVMVEENGEEKILYRLDDATLNIGAQRKIKNKDNVVRAGGKAYLVNETVGSVQPIDPDSLQKVGEPLEFKAEISVGIDDQGRLLVLKKEAATVSIVEGVSASEPISVGSKGDALTVSTVGGRFAVVNVGKGELTRFEGREPAKIILPPGSGDVLVPKLGEGDDLALLRKSGERGELVMVSLKSGAARLVLVQSRVGAVDPPLSTKDAVFLFDKNAGEVITVDPISGAARSTEYPEIGKGPQVEAFVKDGFLWVNDPKGSKAAVIDRNGRMRSVNKYDEKIPVLNADPQDPTPPSPDSPPGSAENPAAPPPNRVPTGPQGSQGPQGSDPAAPPPSESAPPPVANAPGTPGSFKGTAGNRSVSLIWTAPGAGGAPITGYHLTCTPDCGGPATQDLPSAETATVENLVNGRSYSFTLAAVNSIGTGPAAIESNITPTGDVPAKPSNVSAEAKDDGTVTVGWTESDEGLKLSGFQIVATSNSTGLPVTAPKAKTFDVSDAAARSFSTKKDDLGYDVDTAPDWTFTVKALASKDGKPVESAPSSPSNAVDPYERPAFANASVIVGQSADGTSATVTWGRLAPNGRPITRLTITDATGSNLVVVPSPTDLGTSPTFTVRKGTTYAGARGVLTNDAGDSQPQKFSFDTPDVPRFTGFSAAGSNGQVSATVGVASALPVTCFLFVGGTARAEGPCTTLAAGGLGYGPHDVFVRAANAVGVVDSAHQSVTAPVPVGTAYNSGAPGLSGGSRRTENWGGGYRVYNDCPAQSKAGPVTATWTIALPHPGQYGFYIEVGDNGAWPDPSRGAQYISFNVGGNPISADMHAAGWIGVSAVRISAGGSVTITASNAFCSPDGFNKWVYFAGVRLVYEGP